MSIKAKDPNEERITRLEAAQDALAKQISGMDGYFKDPQGLRKQIEDTMIATVPGIIQKEFAEYDKSAQARFATRSDVQHTNTVASAGASDGKANFGGIVQDLVKTVTDVVSKIPSGSRGVDENYTEYLMLRNDLMKKALGGIGRGVGRGIEREITKHVVQFE